MINLDQEQQKINNKRNIFENVNALYEGRELAINAFTSGIFPIKEAQGKRLKILTPKQMLQRLPLALAQVKAGSLCRAKQITKEVYKM